MIDRLRKLVSPTVEQTVHIEDALEHFLEHTEDDRASAERTAERFEEDIIAHIESIEDALIAAKDFDHDHPRVRDVAHNIVEDRLRHIRAFTAPQGARPLYDATTSLLADIGGVTDKEKAVLDYVGEDITAVFRDIRALEDTVNDLDAFLEGSYRVLEAEDRLASYLDDWQHIGAREQELTEDIESIDINELRERLDELEDEHTALADHPDQQRKDELETEIADRREQRDQLMRDIETAAAHMERGLKKLLYAARGDAVDLERQHHDLLADVRDRSFDEDIFEAADELGAALDTVVAQIDAVDISDRQRDRFHRGADTLQDVDEHAERRKQLEGEIEDLKAELDDIDLDERRERLKRQQEQVRTRAEQRVDERNRLRDQRDRLADDRRDLLTAVEDLLDEHLSADITVEMDESRL